MTHQWMILAYGTSPYLESCVQSLLAQTVRTEIRIATSTPSDALSALAAKYDLPIVVHEGGSIAADWNGAILASDADLVTLAHQDDVYEPEYTARVLAAAGEAAVNGEQPQILFTDYYELRGERHVSDNRNLRIKQILLRPVRARWLRRRRFGKRLPICIGNAICCPSVTYVRRAVGLEASAADAPTSMPDQEIPHSGQNMAQAEQSTSLARRGGPFAESMHCNLDWQLWERLSRQQGSFVYVPELLMGHRIHEESTTSALIEDHRRADEDLAMLEHFWPGPIARIIEHWYRHAEDSNAV